MLSPDYEDLFKTLNTHKIKYLIVGAHAVTFYTEPRFTKDLDIWIPPVLNRPEAVYEALKDFGTPLRGLKPRDFEDPSMILQIGVAPVRIDIMTDVSHIDPIRAWKTRKRSRYGKTPVSILGLADLIRAKKAADRPQDRLDLTRLLRRSTRS